jgi:hypothetical protein
MLCRQNLLLGLFVLVFGMAVVVWPEKLQAIKKRSQERFPKLAALNPFYDWIRSPFYLVIMRFAGFVLICISALVFSFAWRACSGN